MLPALGAVEATGCWYCGDVGVLCPNKYCSECCLDNQCKCSEHLAADITGAVGAPNNQPTRAPSNRRTNCNETAQQQDSLQQVRIADLSTPIQLVALVNQLAARPNPLVANWAQQLGWTHIQLIARSLHMHSAHSIAPASTHLTSVLGSLSALCSH